MTAPKVGLYMFNFTLYLLDISGMYNSPGVLTFLHFALVWLDYELF
jgi:hypothetical protein